jgi:hypothetical protein
VLLLPPYCFGDRYRKDYRLKYFNVKLSETENTELSLYQLPGIDEW